MTAKTRYYLYEVHVNGRKIGTYARKDTADREAAGILMGTSHKVVVRKVKRLPGLSIDDEGNTIIIDARGYGRRLILRQCVVCGRVQPLRNCCIEAGQ